MKIFNNTDTRNDVKTIYIGFKKSIPQPKKAIKVFGMGWKEWGLIILLGAILIMSAPPELITIIKHNVLEFIK